MISTMDTARSIRASLFNVHREAAGQHLRSQHDSKSRMNIAAPSPGNVRVCMVVSVPADAPPDDVIYVAGNHASLGNWRADGVPLKCTARGEYEGEIDLPCNEKVEFKFTLGSWETAELAADGRAAPNRQIRAESGTLLLLRVERWGRGATSASPTSPPQLKRHRAFPSRILGTQRTLTVYLPPNYELDVAKRYPVLYMQDGQNLFDASTAFGGVHWGVRETADRLISDGEIEPLIIVGIDNTEKRTDEYTPTFDPLLPGGGRGEAYVQFLTEELKPFIDARYRTMPRAQDTAIGGSSLGGLISLFACFRRPDVFARCAALSPSLWWNSHDAARQLTADPNWMSECRLWIDIGTNEASQVPAAMGHSVHCVRELAEFLQRAGLESGRDFTYREFIGAGHDERAWSQRLDQVLVFLFGR